MPTQRNHSLGLVEQLSRNSTPYHDPIARIHWDSLDHSQFWLPEPAVSVYGQGAYAALPMRLRQRLSQYEFLYFVQAGLWLEGLFMERIARSLSVPTLDLARSSYHLHELREEAGHSLMFLELIRRSRLSALDIPWRRPRLMNFVARHAPFDSLALWLAVLIGEEVPDRMNRFVRKHRDDICPAIYDMVSLHIMDESRHLAHARETVGERLRDYPAWRKTVLRPLVRMLFRQFVLLLFFPHRQVYRLAGLSQDVNWSRLARTNTYRHAFIQECVQSSLRVLHNHGLAVDWT